MDEDGRDRKDELSGEPEIVGNRYAVAELLGAGAFAFTYRARDIRLGREVALKILRPHFAHDATFTARFTREAVAVASISHRNVVDVYDHGPHGDTLFIAMEYVAGRTLREHRLNAGGRLAPTAAVDITVQVLRGLQAVHRAGIIHRDIKPENILIGEDVVARLADFGIATDPTGAALTMTGTTLGTVAYMAPEQARGEALSPAADLYAVGAVLYELLTGRLPFHNDNAVAMMLAHQQEAPPTIRQVAPEAGIPARLETIVMASLAKAPRARFSSAMDMERALLGHGDRISVPASAPTARLPTVQLPRQSVRPAPVRYSPAPVATGGGRGWLVALVVLAALAGSTLAAAWWSGWPEGGNDQTTAIPRLLEAAPNEATNTPVRDATEPPDDDTAPPPIVPIATEPPPAEAPTDTPTQDQPSTATVEATETESPVMDEEWAPAPDGDSPSIVPVD